MTSAAQATGAGNKHQAHSPKVPSTRCRAHTRDRGPSGTRPITPAPPPQPGPHGGGRQGSKRHFDNWWTRNQTTAHNNVPTTAPAPQTKPQAPGHASVPQAWTARSIAPKTPTTVTCRGATSTTTTAPAIQAEGGHQTHRPQAPHTRCTAHSGKNPDTSTQRPKGTLITAPGRPTQPGPTGKEHPERLGAQRRPQNQQDHTPSQRTDYSGRATNRATSYTPCWRTPSQDRTESSVKNTDRCHTPRHRAQHHDNRDNAPGPEPQTAPLAREATQPSAPEDHTHEAPLSASSGTSGTALQTHSQISTPAKAPNPPPESLPSGLDIPANHNPMDLDCDQLQDSIERVLQLGSPAQQRPTWSLYRALNETE